MNLCSLHLSVGFSIVLKVVRRSYCRRHGRRFNKINIFQGMLPDNFENILIVWKKSRVLEGPKKLDRGFGKQTLSRNADSKLDYVGQTDPVSDLPFVFQCLPRGGR